MSVTKILYDTNIKSITSPQRKHESGGAFHHYLLQDYFLINGWSILISILSQRIPSSEQTTAMIFQFSIHPSSTTTSAVQGPGKPGVNPSNHGVCGRGNISPNVNLITICLPIRRAWACDWHHRVKSGHVWHFSLFPCAVQWWWIRRRLEINWFNSTRTLRFNDPKGSQWRCRLEASRNIYSKFLWLVNRGWGLEVPEWAQSGKESVNSPRVEV